MEEDIYEVIKLGDVFTYKNKITGKLCDYRFDKAEKISEGWGVVKIDDKYTYFNPSTGVLCKQMFDKALDVCGGWGSVLLVESGVLVFNPNTQSFAMGCFDDMSIVDDEWARVKIGEYYYIYNPNENYLFTAKFEEKNLCTIAESLKLCPEDFAHLPTSLFRDKEKIKLYLNVIAEKLKASCSSTGATADNLQYARDIQKLIHNKIETEKENILREDEVKKGIDEIANDLEDLGSEL